MLFQGEEWAASTPFQFFSDHTDPELGRATSEGRVREFQAFGWDPARVPDPQSPATFERSRLDWSELESEPHRDMLAWHRQLIHLRRDLPELHDGRLDAVQVSWSEERRWLLLRRGSVTLAVNLASEPQRLEVGGAVLAASHAGVTTEAGTLTLPGESAAVLRESSQADG
jgi:maltooligosyltrehalose trehalohydrolase